MPDQPEREKHIMPTDRREFLKRSAGYTVVGGVVAQNQLASPAIASDVTEIDFAGPSSLVHPHQWESLNPGYWQIRDGALRRRLKNVGDRARRTGFPFHSMSKGGVMETDYDPSLPAGIIYRRDQKLTGAFTLRAEFTYRADRPEPSGDDRPEWAMFQPGHGAMGIAFGSKSLFESYQKIRHAVQSVWCDDESLRIITGKKKQASSRKAAPKLNVDQKVLLTVKVVPDGATAKVTTTIQSEGGESTLTRAMPTTATEGYVGIVGRGLIDFEVNSFSIDAPEREPSVVGTVDCFACYPLGDTLSKTEDGTWQVRFVGLFASDGDSAQIRVAETPQPEGEWKRVPVAGTAKIISNDFRRNTAVIDANLPVNPAESTLYYTVWKDGVDVTADARVGTEATGPGTGLVGDVPDSGQYVGRLPQLKAPYKLCGLSCHAITSGLQQRGEQGYRIMGGGDDWQFRDQPTVDAYRHLDDYDFQVMVWEDDVWYMELVLYPPSTDDAYGIVTQSICGPASRWQLMRHWNVINPGDHDYGMDDVKGPEQLAIRRVSGLGQDVTYMRRNFQIVHHLTTGAEQVDPLANPKKWRAWKMPNRDFTFVVLDSRLWRSSQDTDMWDDSGWDAFKGLYDRTDPTRSLLGEEQFAWLARLLATDASRLICLTGINGMHTIWTGGAGDFESGKHPMKFSQRDRVTADYAGWVKAGSDRVLDLLGSRDGVVTVYGDVHNGCIMKNSHHRVIECSFGPIGRSGGRGVIPGFAPKMKDVDGRDLEIHSLYHKTHADANLSPHKPGDPFYWNFLEMEFDPTHVDPKIGLRVRNLVDAPDEAPRGGGSLETVTSQTGRPVDCRLQPFQTLANADVRFMRVDGRPIRATRSRVDGSVPLTGLVDVDPGESVIMIAYDGENSESKVLKTI